MIRWLAKLALLCIVLWLVPMLIIHAQPYDDASLRAALQNPVDCPTACFMGIQVEITRTREVLDLLRAHDWVADVESVGTYYRAEASELIYWQWSGLQPDWIDDSQRGEISFRNHIVSWIQVHSRIPMGQLWLAFGQPENGTISAYTKADSDFAHYSGGYPDMQLRVLHFPNCSFESFWREPTVLTWYQQPTGQAAVEVGPSIVEAMASCR